MHATLWLSLLAWLVQLQIMSLIHDGSTPGWRAISPQIGSAARLSLQFLLQDDHGKCQKE